MDTLHGLGANLLTTMGDILPIAAILFGFQYLVIRRPLPRLKQVLTGFGYVLLGMTLFLEGLEIALFPLGKLMAQQLTDPGFIFGAADRSLSDALWTDYAWVYAFGAALTFATAIAEPALYAVAAKAQQVSGGAISASALRIVVALGAATGTMLGTLRIVTGIPLYWMIIAGYALVLLQTAFAPRNIVALAYDSGGVTTSTVTVPMVTALGLGLAAQVPGRYIMADGFGMIALTCLFPVISVLGYAQLSEWWTRRHVTYRGADASHPE